MNGISCTYLAKKLERENKGMKHNFKKLFAFLLATLMLSSMVLTAIPVSAAGNDFPKQLANNENVVVNGVTYRFDRLSQNSESKAVVNPDNTITLTMKQGDLFWIPSVTLGNDSVLNMKVTLDSSNGGKNKSQIACGLAYNIETGTDGVWGEDTDSLNVLNVQTNFRVRLGNGTVAKMKGGSLSNTFTNNNNLKDNEVLKNWYSSSNVWANGKMLEMNLQLNDGTTVVASFRDDASNEFASLNYTVEAEPKVFEGPVGFGVNWSGDGGDAGYLQVTIKSFEITNAVVNGEKTNFSLSSSLTYADTVGVVIPMRLGNTEIDFDGEYGFIDLDFTIDETVSSDTNFVVKKNGEVIDRKALSTFVPVDGLYKYFTYFTNIEYTDVLTVCLEKDNVELEKSSYDVEYGAAYKKFVTDPDLAVDADLSIIAYSEDFSTPIELVPGENIVNGHKWTYIKNSSDGSAVIKDGKLYFTGSNYDMILFDDVNVDKQPYQMVYNVTYLDTPADDIWDAWSCWFGGLFHLSDTADENGNKSAFITAVTPNDVYMLDGKFGSDGVFTQTDGSSDHITFLNDPSSPTQGNNCYYWGGRVGNGLPAKVSTWLGTSDHDSGGVGTSAYNAQGDHRVSSNLPGAIPGADRKTGSIGFVCGESKVNVIVDDLVVNVKGKNITVDGEQIQIVASGEVDVADFQKDDMNFIYASVDGTVKYAGNIITANRLTDIKTVQIALKTNKVVADGQTGLKWTTEISKADYEKLTADANIAKVEFGTVVVPTANAKDGVDKNNTAKIADITATATADGNKYVFSGVLPVGKEARDTSYSGVGYVVVTMTDGTQIVAYADYSERNHAYALSDLVENFTDDTPDTETNDGGSDNTPDTPSTNDATGNTEKKGCGSSVVGVSGLVVISIMGCACMVTRKKTKKN